LTAGCSPTTIADDGQASGDKHHHPPEQPARDLHLADGVVYSRSGLT
jgi:hypothetical protein